MFKGSLAALAASVALLATPLAAASTVDRVRVAGPGVTSAFPRGISLELTSPPTYNRTSADVAHGVWSGPQYWAASDPTKRGTTSIRWSVDFEARPGPVTTVALTAPTHGWPLDKKDPIAVPHYVGKQVVGTILGYYAITHAPAPDDGSYEAALAFAVAPKAFTVVRFDLSGPPTDSETYLVNGLDPPSIWNRGQAFWSLSGVRLVGNLPPSSIELSAVGRTLRGAVLDAFHHPVLGLPVSIQRRVGTSWRPLASARTDRKGEFRVRAARGTYRAVTKSRKNRVVSSVEFVG